MKVGIPREVKNHEYRVAITPAGVHELVPHGHEVFVEAGAGVGSSITDEEYVAAGATILPTADDVWETGDLVLKVKEPVAEEYHRMREGQVLFTYLHLAADQAVHRGAADARHHRRSPTRPSSCPTGSLPLLAPDVGGRRPARPAGRRAHADAGPRRPRRADGRRPGVRGQRQGRRASARGVSGQNAANIALGMGADVHAPRPQRSTSCAEVDWRLPGPRARRSRPTRTSIEQAGARGRPGDRRRADPGREGAQAGHQRPGRRR